MAYEKTVVGYPDGYIEYNGFLLELPDPSAPGPMTLRYRFNPSVVDQPANDGEGMTNNYWEWIPVRPAEGIWDLHLKTGNWTLVMGASHVESFMRERFPDGGWEYEIFDCGDTSGASHLDLAFESCSGLYSFTAPLDISGCGGNIECMFRDCGNLRTVGVFDTSTATTAFSLFEGCVSLEAAPALDLSSCTDFRWMFGYDSNLVSVPLYDLSSATTVAAMFYDCRSLASVPLFNTANVRVFDSMLEGCSALTAIPTTGTGTLYSFDTSSATSVREMFAGCSSLVSAEGFSIGTATDIYGLFSGCSSLASAPMINMANVTNASFVFAGCTSLATTQMNFYCDSATTLLGFFSGCRSLTPLQEGYPKFHNTGRVTSTDSMFKNCERITASPELDTTANVTDMDYMYQGCTALRTVPVLDISRLLDMDYMFDGCSAVTSGAGAFYTAASTKSPVPDHTHAFRDCGDSSSIPSDWK